MGKFLRSLTDGTLRCRYCGDRDCCCLEDGNSVIDIIKVCCSTEKAMLVQLRKGTLPNGRKIPAKAEVWIPIKSISKTDLLLKKMVVENDFINRMIFD